MMQQHNISKLNDYCDTINRELMQISSFKPESSKSVCDAMEYSLTAGGKRIRPLLALEFCKICGGDTASFAEFMFRIEKIIEERNINCLVTASAFADSLPAGLERFLENGER